jgi:hypothetical protein
MSEYIEIETEMLADPAMLLFHTNLRLIDRETEVYESPESMEEGSALAQALAQVEGLVRLRIEEHELTVTRNTAVSWHLIIAEVNAALKDFFL